MEIASSVSPFFLSTALIWRAIRQNRSTMLFKGVQGFKISSYIFRKRDLGFSLISSYFRDFLHLQRFEGGKFLALQNNTF